jgi:colicin import membrane protein
MTQAATTCGFPGCPHDRVPAPPGGGRPSAYCADPAHNAASAFRARRAAQQPSGDRDQAGERPASLAGLRLRSVADQVRDELAGHRDRLEQLVDAALESFGEAGDPAAVEAELAACGRR